MYGSHSLNINGSTASFHPHEVTFLKVSSSGLWFWPPCPSLLLTSFPPVLPPTSKSWRPVFMKACLWHLGTRHGWGRWGRALSASSGMQRCHSRLSSQHTASHVRNFLKTQACKSRAQSTPHLQDTPRPDSPSNNNTTETVYSFYLHKILPWFSAVTKLTPPLSSSNSSLRRIRSSLCPGPMSSKKKKQSTDLTLGSNMSVCWKPVQRD